MIPVKTVKINGRKWTVEVLDHVDIAEEFLGLCDAGKRKISIKSGSLGSLQDTLFHEMIHASCPSLTEEQVLEVERGVYAFLSDNPKVRKWLFKNETGFG
jgi:hypothetical protein